MTQGSIHENAHLYLHGDIDLGQCRTDGLASWQCVRPPAISKHAQRDSTRRSLSDDRQGTWPRSANQCRRGRDYGVGQRLDKSDFGGYVLSFACDIRFQLAGCRIPCSRDSVWCRSRFVAICRQFQRSLCCDGRRSWSAVVQDADNTLAKFPSLIRSRRRIGRCAAAKSLASAHPNRRGGPRCPRAGISSAAV